MSRDSRQPRVAYLCPRDHTSVASQWAIWRSGAIAVPLPEHYPNTELEYFLQDCDASAAVIHCDYAEQLKPLLKKRKIGMLLVNNCMDSVSELDYRPSAQFTKNQGALIIYTSGTTGKPKGVLTTHEQFEAQINSLIEAWAWRSEDRVLHVLPLHHVHGLMAVLSCSLWAGATCEMLPKFDAAHTWEALMRSKNDPNSVSLFMAVPTIYARLIQLFEEQAPEMQRRWTNSLRSSRMRLYVAGSAALPESTFQRWMSISGLALLERYGMSEFGMALSNPLEGPRVVRSVGKPLPNVDARLVDEGNPNAVAGELHIRGPNVFKEYWNRADATAEVFAAAEDGGHPWFKTGDLAERDSHGYYFIKGRLSMDIIKSGGYKISALDIEHILLQHPDIKECAVLGAPDATYGERVAAVVVLKSSGLRLDGAHLKEWAKDRLASYKIPSLLKIVSALPRNAMGKINKKQLLAEVFGAKT